MPNIFKTIYTTKILCSKAPFIQTSKDVSLCKIAETQKIFEAKLVAGKIFLFRNCYIFRLTVLISTRVFESSFFEWTFNIRASLTRISLYWYCNSSYCQNVRTINYQWNNQLGMGIRIINVRYLSTSSK